MKAIIVTGGKQYLVNENDELYVEKLDVEAGKDVVFDKVLFVDGQIGAPYVEGAKVTATVIKHGKQKKVIVFKYKNKTIAFSFRNKTFCFISSASFG